MNKSLKEVYCGDYHRCNANKSSRDSIKYLGGNLSKKELEDLNYSLVESNNSLKKTVNQQKEDIKQLSTKVLRLSAIQKKKGGNPDHSQECFEELKRENEKMAEKIQRLNIMLCTVNQFSRKNPGKSRCQCSCPASFKASTTSVFNIKSDRNNIQSTESLTNTVNLPVPNNSRNGSTVTPLEKESPKIECVDNKCTTQIEELKRKIVDLQEELVKTKSDYSERTSTLEHELSCLKAEVTRTQAERARSESNLREKEDAIRNLEDRLLVVEGGCIDSKLQLSLEQKRVTELEAELKSARMSADIARTIQHHFTEEPAPARQDVVAFADTQHGNPVKPGNVTFTGVEDKQPGHLNSGSPRLYGQRRACTVPGCKAPVDSWDAFEETNRKENNTPRINPLRSKNTSGTPVRPGVRNQGAVNVAFKTKVSPKIEAVPKTTASSPRKGAVTTKTNKPLTQKSGSATRKGCEDTSKCSRFCKVNIKPGTLFEDSVENMEKQIDEVSEDQSLTPEKCGHKTVCDMKGCRARDLWNSVVLDNSDQDSEVDNPTEVDEVNTSAVEKNAKIGVRSHTEGVYSLKNSKVSEDSGITMDSRFDGVIQDKVSVVVMNKIAELQAQIDLLKMQIAGDSLKQSPRETYPSITSVSTQETDHSDAEQVQKNIPSGSNVSCVTVSDGESVASENRTYNKEDKGINATGMLNEATDIQELGLLGKCDPEICTCNRCNELGVIKERPSSPNIQLTCDSKECECSKHEIGMPMNKASSGPIKFETSTPVGNGGCGRVLFRVMRQEAETPAVLLPSRSPPPDEDNTDLDVSSIASTPRDTKDQKTRKFTAFEPATGQLCSLRSPSLTKSSKRPKSSTSPDSQLSPGQCRSSTSSSSVHTQSDLLSEGEMLCSGSILSIGERPKRLNDKTEKKPEEIPLSRNIERTLQSLRTEIVKSSAVIKSTNAVRNTHLSTRDRVAS